LTVESLPLLEYLHEFVVDLITVQLFKNVLLVLKLILRLPGLLCSLLLLDQRVGVLGLVDSGIARLGFHTL
jgi:hypothetical protein